MRAPLPTETLRAIRLPTWHALFAAFGFPPRITHADDDLPRVVSALQGEDLPVPLARALFTIAAFATEAGRTDIYNAADALGYVARWPDASSPADLVATLLASSVADAAVAELLDAARILRDRCFRPLVTCVYVGTPGIDPIVGEPTQYLAPLRASFASWAERRNFGDVVSLDARVEAGAHHYEIVHEDRPVTVLLRSGRASAGKKLRQLDATIQRPVRSHQVVYEPSVGRLWITTDCTEAVTPLASIAGRVFFQNPRHFLDPAAIDLWTLQEHGEKALTVPALTGKVTMIAIAGTWHSGKSHAITPRGRNFFKALTRYKIRIEGGRIDLVTLRATLAPNRDVPPGAPSQSDIVLRPPHLLTVSEPEAAPLLHEFLDRAKIMSPSLRPHDFFALQPWIAPATVWIASEGEAGFASLVARGLLEPDPTNRTVVPPDHPHAGPTATAYPLRGSKFLAWSADPTVAPFVIEEKDLVVYALAFAKLALVIAAALGLDGPAAKLDDDGVLYCGRRVLGPTYVLVFLLTRPIRPATAVRLREAAGYGHAILIVPEGRAQDLGLRQLPMPKLAAPWEPLLSAMVRTLRLESLVDTPLYAPPGSRVVLHRATKRIWIDAHLCALLTDAHFALLDILITYAGTLVHSKDIAVHIAKGKFHRDTTRRAIDSLLLAVEKCFRASKKEPPADLGEFIAQPSMGRYTLTVAGFAD